jgi:hypothetical protein
MRSKKEKFINFNLFRALGNLRFQVNLEEVNCGLIFKHSFCSQKCTYILSLNATQ